MIARPGYFLDVGCGQPVAGNNTSLLEEMGWHGFAFDLNAEMVEKWQHCRRTKAVLADVTKYDFTKLPLHRFDYLSLDVDEAQVKALRNLLDCGISFKCATIEHDSYRFGTGPRDEIRSILLDCNYRILHKDVTYGGNAYEDWWVSRAIWA